jgi:hypothetical protein
MSNLRSAVVAFLVRDDNGDVSTEATLRKYASELSKYLESQKADLESISQLCDALGQGQLKGVPAPKGTWVAMIVRELNPDPSAIVEVSKRVDTYISESPCFKVGRGPNAGTTYLITENDRAARAVELEVGKREKAERKATREAQKRAEDAALKAAGLRK